VARRLRSPPHPPTPVVGLDELVDRLAVIRHPAVGDYRVIPSPVRFSVTPAALTRHAPLVGEHTAEVLREVGYSPATSTGS
jgi:crotonobetainyl-CoA:carnitine CoA-transferase CaiB-like acyl-CoA transferase